MNQSNQSQLPPIEAPDRSETKDHSKAAFDRTMPPIPLSMFQRFSTHTTKLNLIPEIPMRDNDTTETIPACIEAAYVDAQPCESKTCIQETDEQQRLAHAMKFSSGAHPNTRPAARHIRMPITTPYSPDIPQIHARTGRITPSRVYVPQTYASKNTILTVPSSPEDCSIAATPVAQTPVRCHADEKTPSITPGTVIAKKYEILSEIARGGYGAVYRARQLGLDRIVALKRLHASDNESIAKRFLLEASIIKNLIHPNTIQLIDAGADDKHLYIVMEYIDGMSLHDILKSRNPIDMMRAIHITCQILKSINEAHQCNIIHRDLKPSNILIRKVIGEEDFVKVLDFGIAKARYKNAPLLTQSGTIMGTPQYIAPELLFGDDAKPSADIYAIGLIFIEMITGHPVMPPDIQSIVKFAASPDAIVLPDEIAKSEVGPIIARSLQKIPEERYQSAHDMLEDLQNTLIRLQLIHHSIQNNTNISGDNRKRYFTSFQKIALVAMILLLSNVLLAVNYIL